MARFAEIQGGVVHRIFEAATNKYAGTALDIRDVTAVDPAPQVGWTVANNVYSAPAAVVQTIIARQTFMDRFPQALRVLIQTVSMQNDAAGAAIRDWLLRFQIVADVHVDDARTIAGVEQLVALGVAASVVAAEDAQNVIDAILAPETVE
jgi:hypothetical protein